MAGILTKRIWQPYCPPCVLLHRTPSVSSQLFERHRALKQSIEARQVALEDARKLRSYQRDARNLCSWIDERRKTARDECYQVQQLVTLTLVFVTS